MGLPTLGLARCRAGTPPPSPPRPVQYVARNFPAEASTIVCDAPAARGQARPSLWCDGHVFDFYCLARDIAVSLLVLTLAGQGRGKQGDWAGCHYRGELRDPAILFVISDDDSMGFKMRDIRVTHL